MNLLIRLRAISSSIKRHPRLFLAASLLLFFGSVGIALFTRPTKQPQYQNQEIKPVTVKTTVVGADHLTQRAVGAIKNLTSVTLVAQASGPVRAIHKTEGKNVLPGQWIVEQESAYAAGNAASVGRQIAEKNAELAKETLASTVDAVTKTREIADQNQENAEKLRTIANDSIAASKTLIDTTKQVIVKLNDDIAIATDEDTKQGLRQQLISFQSIFANAESGMRNLEYQAGGENPPADLSRLNRDLVYQSTELQLKTASLNRDIADLSVKTARIAEAALRVASPIGGTIERIFVMKGQYLTPGTPVAVVRGKTNFNIVVPVAGTLASQIDVTKSMTIMTASGSAVPIALSHVAKTATSGTLYDVVASIPSGFAEHFQEGQTIAVQLPLSSERLASAGAVMIPIDALFVTNTRRYVLLAIEGKAVRRDVTTGSISADMIEVTQGLANGDELILTRSVREGQMVAVERT